MSRFAIVSLPFAALFYLYLRQQRQTTKNESEELCLSASSLGRLLFPRGEEEGERAFIRK